MWTRKELKEKAKVRFKANYWISVLVSLILIALLGSGGGSGSAGNLENINDKEMSKIESMMNGEIIGSEIDKSADEIEETYNEMLNEIGEENSVTVAFVIIGIVIVIAIVLAVLAIFVINPLIVGCRRFFAKNLNEKADLSEVVHMFNDNYKNTVKTMFFKELYTFLWTLLFIIPGIIKSYEYRMVPYLVAMNPAMDTKEVFARSKEMMTGNKWKSFVLDLSFIGWELLNGCTLGLLGLFYVNPYKFQTDAALYERLNGGSVVVDSYVVEA